jgi:transcriptional regulator GlxA family with amidase domain
LSGPASDGPDGPVFAILAYPGVEPIDIGATYGVLSMARRIVPALRFFLVAEHAGEIELTSGLRVVAQHGIDDCPAHDILVVLGGPGWEAACRSAPLVAFVRASRPVTASVCTGAMILGAAGLLAGRRATTKREVLPGEARPLDLLARQCRDARIVEARLVDDGTVVTGGGVALGIDVTLHLLERFCGPAVADETARILEYRAARAANAASLPDLVTAISETQG